VGGPDEELLSGTCPVDRKKAKVISSYSPESLDLATYDYVVEFDPNRDQTRPLLSGMKSAIREYRDGSISLTHLTAELRSRVAAIEDVGGTPWGRQLRSRWRRLADESDALGSEPVRSAEQREAISRALDDLDRFLVKH
jgi:hypothetical protein